MVATNGDLGLYDKLGALRARVGLYEFFAPHALGAVKNIGDPRVVYDLSSRRYFITSANDDCYGNVTIEASPNPPQAGQLLNVAVHGLSPGKRVSIGVIPGGAATEVRTAVDGIARSSVVLGDASPTGWTITVTTGGQTLATRSVGARSAQAPVVASAVCPNSLFLATSTGPDPLTFDAADWHVGSLDGSLFEGKPSGDTGDFGMLAVTNLYIVLSSVRVATGDGPNLPARLWVIDKQALIDGRGVRLAAEFSNLRHPITGSSLITLAPAAGGTGDRAFVVSTSGRPDCGYAVVAVDLTAGPRLDLQHVSATGSCRAAPRIPQLGSAIALDAGNALSAQPVMRDGRLWLTESVASAGTSTDVAAIRVVAIDVRNWPERPQITFDRTLSEPDHWYAYPAIAADSAGDITIVFSRGGPSEFAAIAYTGRSADDADGVFQPIVVLHVGEATSNVLARAGSGCVTDCTRNRWGDYFGAAADPGGRTAWLVGQYQTASCSLATWLVEIDWHAQGAVKAVEPALPAASAAGPC